MPDWQIRDALPDDAAAIIAIFNPIIETGLYTVFDTPFSVETERDYIADQHERGIFHVAVHPDDGRIVGFQVVDPFAAYTSAFDHVGSIGTYVALARRRQGIAAALFPATFEAARRSGYEKLLTFVRGDNPAALATYLGQGFAVVGTACEHAKINGRYIDEIIIERRLIDKRSSRN